MIVIGASFGEELQAAGLAGLPFSWDSNGNFNGRENLTAGQNTALDAVIAAHNPASLTKLQQIAADTFYEDIVTQLRGKTPAQIKTYVTNNVNSLADAKILLAKILLVLTRLV